MFYTVYKITNLLNEKYYIGKHKTLDLNDGYMGSGKLINRAISKYGVENFKKEILFVFDNEIDMNSKEKELVVICEQSYNLCPGGHGGFGYINSTPEIIKKRDKVEYKRAGRLAANAKHAHINGSKRHKFLLETDLQYRQEYSAKLIIGQKNAVRKDCPFCEMKNLNEGNYKRHLKSKHLGISLTVE